MKKLVTILILIVALSSCYSNIEDSVKNPKIETTIQLQDLPKDTVVMSIDGKTLYVFENNLVKYKTVVLKDDVVPINLFALLLIVILLFFSILIIIGLSRNN